MRLKLIKILFYLITIGLIYFTTSCSTWKQYFTNNTQQTNKANTSEQTKDNTNQKAQAEPVYRTMTFLLYASFYSFQAAKEAYKILHQHYPNDQVFIRRVDISQSTEEPQLIYQILIGPIHSQEEATRLTQNIPPWLPYQPQLIKVKTIYH
ncbi:hypothetical protein L3V83_07220 [Thiotrichales bacterium 19X7-9]|nr:hypothetical protein [Thiotrichales bacterium 19X7-9]